MRETCKAARVLDRRTEIAIPGSERELEPAFAALVQRHVTALLVTADPFSDAFKLPTKGQFRDYAVAGCLMSYGTRITDRYRQVGVYAGRILKGTKPADLPMYQSIKLEFVINLRTAKPLGIDIPLALLAQPQ